MTHEVAITYHDAAMVLIEVAGLRLLTDPVLDEKETRIQDGPVLLIKNGDAVAPSALGRIDAVLLSHDQHGDNLDGGGRALLATVPRALTTPDAARRLGGTAKGLEPWQTVTLKAADGTVVGVTAVPAQHAPDALIEIVGPVTGFVIEVGAASPIYISGDTIRFPGTAEIARRYAPVGLALLHIGEAKVDPLGDVALSLSATEAAEFAEELRADTVIPVHFEGWAHLSQGRDAATPILADIADPARVHWLERSERRVFTLAAG